MEQKCGWKLEFLEGVLGNGERGTGNEERGTGREQLEMGMVKGDVEQECS